MLSRKEAESLEKAGTHQITTNLQSKDLKWPHEFKKAQEEEPPVLEEPKAEAKPKPKAKAKAPLKKKAPAKRKTYKTRQMKAEA